jgi:hypothetical protein
VLAVSTQVLLHAGEIDSKQAADMVRAQIPGRDQALDGAFAHCELLGDGRQR